jgi:hypothetical protein
MSNLALPAEALCKGLTVRAAAKQFSAAHTTFQRHIDQKRSGNEQPFYSNTCALWTVFLTYEEGKLTDYITTASVFIMD